MAHLAAGEAADGDNHLGWMARMLSRILAKMLAVAAYHKGRFAGRDWPWEGDDEVRKALFGNVKSQMILREEARTVFGYLLIVVKVER